MNFWKKLAKKGLKQKTEHHHHLLRVPKIKLQSTRKAFYFDGAIKYNNLPLQLRSISERKTFIKKLNDYILTI